ncbi:MAG TPA: hypothetical protein VGW40_01040 [Allosphingosinicella sp.]|nr:hypothetical protein [Allosphingosinicella sp.]
MKLPGAIITGVLLIGAGIFLLDHYDTTHIIEYKLAGLFASELGFAFLIAAIIFVVLEEWAAREHSKTVLGYLYGVHPSGTFFDKLEDYVLKQKFYRGKTIVRYEFKEQVGEHILVELRISYVVTNVSRKNDTEEFVLTGEVNTKPLHTGPTQWDQALGVATIKVRGDEVPRRTLKIVDDRARRCQSYEAKPIDLAYDESVTVEVTHFLVKHDHDSVVWHSSIPCTGVELQLKWPGLALEFAARAVHPDSAATEERKGANSLTVSLDRPFLLDHGFHFWWSPEAGEEGAIAPEHAIDNQSQYD